MKQSGLGIKLWMSSSLVPRMERSAMFPTACLEQPLYCQVLWWDARNMTEPKDRLIIDPAKHEGCISNEKAK